MKKYFKTALTLFLICAFFAFLLALVNKFTSPVIQRNAEKTRLLGLNEVVLNGKIDTSRDEVIVSDNAVVSSYCYVVNDDMEDVGYVLNLKGNGYGGSFTLLGFYDVYGLLVNAKLLENNETQGIGKRYEKPDNIALFSHYDIVPTSKAELTDDDATIVSGASVTFQGLSKALTEGSDFILENLIGGQDD